MLEIIKLGAQWCNPCKAYAPVIKKLEEKYNVPGSNVTVVDYDIDENPDMGVKYGVRSVPTTVFVLEGVVKHKQSGVLDEKFIEDKIKEFKI